MIQEEHERLSFIQFLKRQTISFQIMNFLLGLLFIIGCFMELSHKIAQGSFHARLGQKVEGNFGGLSVIILSVVLFAFYYYFLYENYREFCKKITLNNQAEKME